MGGGGGEETTTKQQLGVGGGGVGRNSNKTTTAHYHYVHILQLNNLCIRAELDVSSSKPLCSKYNMFRSVDGFTVYYTHCVRFLCIRVCLSHPVSFCRNCDFMAVMQFL